MVACQARTLRIVLGVLAALVALGCAHNKRAKTSVLARSSFDFQCPEEDIELTTIDSEGARDLASQIAASGCGHRAVYVFLPDTNTWVLNGVVREAPPDYDPTAFGAGQTSDGVQSSP
ncbi:MAG: hypothetical protein AAF436_06070 [Myxococcota bacterium]